MTKKTPNTHPVIAIDLDGTIWKEEYPDCSVPFDGAIECINDMIRSGYEVIIWTARGGDNLNIVKRVLIDEYGLNPNVKFNEHSNWFTSIYPIGSPKVNASVYFDDKLMVHQITLTLKHGQLLERNIYNDRTIKLYA